LEFIPKLIALFRLSLLVWFLGITTAWADVQYVHDETDRLIEVVDTTGNSAVYRYDGAGNISSIRRYGPGELAIADFIPKKGPIGTEVTIYGVGFSPTAADNTVKFNGAIATVSSASPIKLVATVPAAATTGEISVTVAAQTANSIEPFTVTTDPVNAPPVITGFTPTIGSIGTTLTINGHYFDPIAGNNVVKLNSVRATVSNNLTTRINTSVPTNASSGKLSVRTFYGAAVSADDFFVLPTGYTAAQVGATARITVDGNSTTINTGSAGKIAMVLFDGAQGQNLGLGINTAIFTPSGTSATLKVLTPQGTDLMPSKSFSSGNSFDLPALPSTGTYTLLVIPQTTASVNATLTLSNDLTGTLVPHGVSQAFAITKVGQNARYSFTGTQNQRMGVDITNVTIASSTVSILKPDGSLLVSSTAGTSGGVIPVQTLPASGSYSVFVSPAGVNTGNMTLHLGTPDLTVSSVTPPAAAIGPNSNGSYSIPFSFTVNNIGSSTAKPSWQDRVYLSSDAVLDANDARISAITRSTELAAAESYTLSPTETAAATTAPGEYYLIVVADGYGSGSLAEANETNNTQVSTAKVTLLARPDLTVSSVTPPAAAIGPNSNGSYTIPFSFTVNNIGSSMAKPNWYDRVYLSADAVLDANDASLSLIYRSTELAAAGSYSLSQNVSAAATTAPGEYYLIVVADGNGSGSLAEAIETNNTQVSATKVTLLARPDLTVSGVTPPAGAIGPNSNGTYTIPVLFTVNNIGSSTAKPNWYDRVYLSADAVLDANDASLSLIYRSTELAVAGSYSLSQNVSAAATTAPGEYYLIVVADGYGSGSLAEANETNNTQVSTAKVTLIP
jgi:YD repeat-containing protein